MQKKDMTEFLVDMILHSLSSSRNCTLLTLFEDTPDNLAN